MAFVQFGDRVLNTDYVCAVARGDRGDVLILLNLPASGIEHGVKRISTDHEIHVTKEIHFNDLAEARKVWDYFTTTAGGDRLAGVTHSHLRDAEDEFHEIKVAAGV